MLPDNSQLPLIPNPKNASPLGLGGEAAPYGLTADAQGSSAISLVSKELIFIDSQITDYQSLLSDFGNDANIFILNSDQSGIEQITNIINNYQGLDAIRVFSHGTAGSLQLGNETLTKDALLGYSDSLKAWGDSLAFEGDLLLYGCEVAAGPDGQQFVQQLGQLTGADIAASTNLTGSTTLNGDWNLEYTLGQVEAETFTSLSYGNVLFSALSIQNNILTFNEILNATSDNLTFSTHNGQLLVTHQSLISSQPSYQFNLSDIKEININTGFGDDSITFGNIDFGKLVNVTLEGGAGNDTVIFSENGNLHSYGGNLEIIADTITINKGYTLSTRGINNLTEEVYVRDSGSITFDGKEITIGAQAIPGTEVEAVNILADSADSEFLAGDIDFIVAKAAQFSPLLGFFDNDVLKAEIVVNHAVIKANDILFSASVDNSSLFDADDPEFLQSVAPALDMLEGVNLIAGVARAETKASIVLNEGSQILANSFEASALTNSSAETEPTSLGIGVGVGIIDANSEVIVSGAIATEANLSLSARNENTINVSTESDPVIGGITAAVSVSHVKSSAKVHVTDTAEFTVGEDFTALARTTSKNYTASKSAAPTEDDGKVAISVAFSYEENTTEALVDGKVAVEGETNITAEQSREAIQDDKFEAPLEGVSAEAGVNTDPLDDPGVELPEGEEPEPEDKLLSDIDKAAINKSITDFVDSIKEELAAEDPAEETKGQGSAFGAAGAVAYANFTNSTTARIGKNAEVSSGGDLNISASVDGRPAISASSAVDKPEAEEEGGAAEGGTGTTGGTGATGGAPETKFAGSAAVVIGKYNNVARAYIDDDATVDAGGALSIASDAQNDWTFSPKDFYDDPLSDPEEEIIDSDMTESITLELDSLVLVKNGHTAGGEIGNIYQFKGIRETVDDFSEEDFEDEIRWENLGTTESRVADHFVGAMSELIANAEGVDGFFADSFTQSTAKSDKVSVAGSVAILNLNHTSEAYIGENVKLNKNEEFRSEDNEQTVSVEATSTNESVNLVGNIELPSLAVDTETGEVNAETGGGGTEGGTGAVGGSVLVASFSNQVSAKIKTGVDLYADQLTVNAEAETLGVSIGASGGSAGTFGANGTAVVTTINNVITAQIADGVKAEIGNNVEDEADPSLVVSAHDKSNIANVAGGVIKSENVGIGASLGISNLNREVNALIGNLDATAPSTDTAITSEGHISIEASAEGGIYTFGLAAAVVNDKAPEPAPEEAPAPSDPTPGKASEDPLDDVDGESMQALFALPEDEASGAGTGSGTGAETGTETGAGTGSGTQASNDQGKQGKYGIAISGDVAVNQANDYVRAYINDAGEITSAKEISIQASNDTSLITLSGSAAIVTKKEGSSAGLAGSVSVNLFEGETEAYVTGGGTLSGESLSLEATRTGSILAISAAAAATASENSVSVAGSVSINEISNRTEASFKDSTLTAATDDGQVDLSIAATDSSRILAIGGSVAYGGKAGVGAAIAVNLLDLTTLANITDANISQAGELDISATNDSNIKAISASVGASKTAGGAGTVSVNKIDSRTEAFITGTHGSMEEGETTPLSTAGNVTLEAHDTADIGSIAGAVGLGKTAGLGAAVAYNHINSDALAHITESTLSTEGEVNLDASSERTIQTLSLGVGGGQDVGLAGSLSINRLEGETAAYMDNATVTATDLIQATAITEDEISALSGGIAGSSKAAIGAAASVNSISSQTKAYLLNSKVTSENSEVIVESELTSNINNITVGGSGAGTFALGGAVSVNAINTVTEATISDGSEVTAAQNVEVSAIDTSQIQSLAGGVAGASNAAVGAAVATNTIKNQALASIKDSTVTSREGEVNVNADLVATVKNITVGGAGAGDFALGGAVSVNNIGTLTEATIAEGAEVTAQQGIDVFAIDTSKISSLAGGVAGSGTAAIGVSLATNNINNETSASISDSNATSEAGAVTVEADLLATIGNITIGGAGGGTAAVGGAVSVNNVNTLTEATISDESEVMALQNVEVLTTDESKIESLAGGLAGGGTGAGGAGVATNNINNQALASILGSTVTSTEGEVNVDADLSATVKNVTIGGAAAGSFAVGGAVSLNNIGTLTEATIAEGSEVTAQQSVDVVATDTSKISSLAGGVAFGGDAAFGASLATNNINNQTNASISASNVTSETGSVTVEADLLATIGNITIGGAGGGTAAVGGAVSVNTVNTVTEATISNESEVTALQNVEVLVTDASQIESLAGGLAGGGTGAGGAGIATNTVNNQALASILGSTVTSTEGEVNVDADLSATVKNVTIGGAAAGSFAFGGAVSVNNIGTLTEATIAEGSEVTALQSVDVLATDTSNISSLAGGVAVSGSAAAGAALATNNINNHTTASISDSIVTSETGQVTVEADLLATIENATVGGAGGGTFALGGAVSVNNVNTITEATISEGSEVTALQSVEVLATDGSEIESLAGGVAAGGTGAAGAGVATNNINNQAIASILGSTVTSTSSQVSVKAALSATVENITVGGAGAGSFALGGAVSVNNISTLTEATIAEGAEVTAQQGVDILATDNSQISSLAGGVAGGGDAAIGAAVATNTISNRTKASISDAIVVSEAGQINVKADLSADIKNITVGGAGAGTFAAGGAVSINNINTVTEATISSGSEVTAPQAINVSAIDRSQIQSFAGGVAAAGAAAAGAAVATNNLNNQTKASIQGSKATSTGSQVSVKADLSATVENITVGGAGAGGFALGGAVSVNNINTLTEATVANGADVTAQQGVDIFATDTSRISSIAGGAAGSGGAAIGAAVATNNINNRTKANISSAKVTSLGDQVNVKANLSATIENITAGGAGAGGFAAGGAISVNNIGTATEASVTNNSTVAAQQDVQLLATNNATIKSLAGQVSGAGSAAIGASVAINNIDGNTAAFVQGSRVTAGDDVVVSATGTEAIESLAAGASVSGGVALTGSVSVNNMTGSLAAYTDGATVTSESLDITAKETASIKSLAGQVSVSLGVGVGAAIAYNNIGNEVKAYAKNSTINTSGNVVIAADSQATIETLAAGLSAGLVGVGGSVAVNELSQETSAYVEGGLMLAQGSVGILADSNTLIKARGGTLAAGLAGVGGTVLVNHLDNDTSAYVHNATVNAQGNQLLEVPKTADGNTKESIQGLGVIATSEDNLTDKIATGAVGGAGFAATVSVNTLTNRTQAYAKNSGININEVNSNANQSTYIKALSQTDVEVKAGAASLGISAAVGATVDVTTVKNLTAAYVDNDANRGLVKSRKDLVIEANAKKTVDTTAIAAGGSLGIAAQGAVSVLNVGSAISAQGIEAVKDTQKTVNDNLTALKSMGKDSKGNSSIATRQDTTAAWQETSEPLKGTVAFLKGKAIVNQDISINADETTTVDALSGAAAGGVVGVGGAVAIANITHNISAYIGDNSTLTVGREGDIHLNAQGLVEAEGQALAGAAGAVGLGAAVTYLTSKNNTSAYIGSGTKITQARDINITAGSSSNVEAESLGASVGAVAIGVVIADAKESGTTQAYVGNGVDIKSTNSLTVQGLADESVLATAKAGVSGLIAGSGAIPTATVSPTIKAFIGDNSVIEVAGAVTLKTNVEVDGDAEAKGVTVGLLGVGVSNAKVNANPDIQTFVGTGTNISAETVTIESRLGTPLAVTDTSFTPSAAVDNTKNTVSFSENHGLRTGDTVFYLNGGGSSIGGLTDQSSYSVIKVDDKTVKLGKEFAGGKVDVRNNTIKFDSSHGFINGQKVIYEAPANSTISGLSSGTTYYVAVVDSQTIKLTTSPVSGVYTPVIKGASATNLVTPNTGTAGTAVTISNHGFNNSDILTYSKRTAKFTIVNKMPDGSGDKNIFNLKDTVANDNVINSADHNFATNDKVIYRTTGAVLGGLANDGIYYVIKVNDNSFKLASAANSTAIDINSAVESTSHEISAVGLTVRDIKQFSYTTDNSTNKITLSNHGFTDGQVVYYQPEVSSSLLSALDTQGNSYTLTSQGQYYIKKVDNNSFQLSATQGGSVINLVQKTGTQNLFVDSLLDADVPYYVVQKSTNSFKVAKTSGGAALTLRADGLGSGVNQLFSKEQSGIVDIKTLGQGTHNLHFDLTSAGATGSKHSLSKGAGITVPSQGDNVFSAHAQASSGGLIGVDATQASLNISPSMRTYIGNSSKITAKGNVTVNSLSSVETTGSTDSSVFGAIAVGASEINANITNNNTTYVGDNAIIKAGGKVVIEGKANQEFSVSGSGGAGSLITFADAEAHTNLAYNNTTFVGSGANIIAQEDITVKSLSTTDGRVSAEAYGAGLYADADAETSLNVSGNNQTDIKNNAKLEGRKVNIEAVVEKLKVEARSESDGAGLIGNIDATARVNLTGTKSTVAIADGAAIKGDYVNLKAEFSEVTSNALADADCDGLGGDTDATAENIMPLDVRVSTSGTSTITAHDFSVASDFKVFNRNTSAEHDRAWELRIWTPFGDIVITMDFGSTDKDETYQPAAYIDFNSNVNLLARDVNPVLVIDKDGRVLQESKTGMAQVGTVVFVNDITNNQAGSVNFSAKGTTNGQFTDRGKYGVINPAYDTVKITNYSNKDLVINNIQTLSTGATAPISYSGVQTSNQTKSTTSNPSSLSVNPTLVSIENFGNSNLVLKGVINNDLNRVVLYSAGGILSEGSGQKIIARELSLEAATGNIGTSGQRIAAQLNQGLDRPVTDVTRSRKNKLEATAQGSINLDLTAKRVEGSDLVTMNIEKIDALTGEVNVLARQSVDQNNQAIDSLYAFSDPRMKVGTNAVFNANNSSIDVVAKSDFLGNGFLDVATGGSVDWTALSGKLNVKRAVSTNESVKLAVDEPTDVTLLDNAVVSAASADNNVTIEASGNFNFRETATITAANNISIRGDLKSNSRSSVVNWEGQAKAKEVLISGGNHDNTFNIRQSMAGSLTKVLTGEGTNIVNVGDKNQTLAGIQGDIEIQGANVNSQDTLNIDASGNSSGQIGKLTGSLLSGLGAVGKIIYSQFEALNLNLGNGDDELAVLGTGAVTTIDGKGGSDRFRVGAELTASGSGLTESVAGVEVNAYEIGGVNHATTIKGGSGNDRFIVNRNVEQLSIQGNEGDDTLVVNTPVDGSGLVSNGNVSFTGDEGSDRLEVNNSQVANLSKPNSSTIEVQNSRTITIDSSTESIAPENIGSTTGGGTGTGMGTGTSGSATDLFSSLLNGTGTGTGTDTDTGTGTGTGTPPESTPTTASGLFASLFNLFN